MKRLPNIHPGEILLEEFMKPFNISVSKLSEDIGISASHVYKILKGERGFTADIALRLSYYFSNSPKFWLGLQDDFDLEEEAINKKEELKQVKKLSVHAA